VTADKDVGASVEFQTSKKVMPQFAARESGKPRHHFLSRHSRRAVSEKQREQQKDEFDDQFR